MTEKIEKELVYIAGEDFVLGKFIYMGMGLVRGRRVCLAVAYKIDYCYKKAKEFEAIDSNVQFTHINKVKVGDLMECDKFPVN